MGNQYDSDNEIEIDLKDLVLELLAFWKLVVFAAVLAAVIGFSVSEFVMIPKYQSTSALYVLPRSNSITSLTDLQTGASLTNDYLVVVKGRPVLEQVITNLGLPDDYKTLRERVSLNNPSNSRILEITVTDENPIAAKAIADEVAMVSSAFIAEKMEQDPPTILQFGYADGEPVSPNIPRNTVLGGLVGVLFASAIIILSYLFNDTIMTPEDVEKKLGLNVLGTLPMEEAEDDGERKPSKKRRKKGKGKK